MSGGCCPVDQSLLDRQTRRPLDDMMGYSKQAVVVLAAALCLALIGCGAHQQVHQPAAGSAGKASSMKHESS